MRSTFKWLALSSASLLAACGGDTGVQTVGNVAPPAGGTPTPTHSFVAPTDPKTYEGLGAVEHYQYSTRSDSSGQSGQLYAGDANTVRDSGISISYNPRDAIFELTINRPLGDVSVSAFRFQDPAHRTNFPQGGTPALTLSGIHYLQVGSGTGNTLDPTSPYYTARAAQSGYTVGDKGFSSTVSTLFYQQPGTTTSYVTYAGFVSNTISATEDQDSATSPLYLKENYSFDRAAFVFGERTPNSAVPSTGSATYTGDMLATMVYNPAHGINPNFPTYFQWIQGSQSTLINFGTMTFKTDLLGTVLAPTLDAYTNGSFAMAAGSTFSASASGTIDLVNKGGFTGGFTCATFNGSCGATPVTGNPLVIAGSSLDGAFFGPAAQEVGGGFRIVGGTPDQRIDILGAFTGKK